MLKLTYREAKDFSILPTIEAMKELVLPFRFNYWLLKIHRKLQKEMSLVEQQLRDVLLEFVEKDDLGKLVPQPEERDADGKIVTPARDWKYKEGGEEAHRKAFAEKAEESMKIEFIFPEIEPLDFSMLENTSIQLSHLAGLDPLGKEYQSERGQHRATG